MAARTKFQSLTGGNQPPCWDLTQLYKGQTDPAFTRDEAETLQRAADFQRRYKRKLHTLDGKSWARAFGEYQDIYAKATQLYSYAILLHSQDINNEETEKFSHDVSDRSWDAERYFSFFDKGAADMKRRTIAEFSQHPRFKAIVPVLDSFQAMKGHTLSVDLEEHLARSSSFGTARWGTQKIQVLSEMTYRMRNRELDDEAIKVKLQSADPTVRRDAAAARAAACDKKAEDFAEYLNDKARQRQVEDEARGLSNPVMMEIFGEGMDLKELTVLMRGARRGLPETMHRFNHLKARFLGQRKLEEADFTAPFRQQDNAIPPTTSWAQTEDIVTRAFRQISPVMSRRANWLFANNRVDAQARPGKEQGPYSWNVGAPVGPFISLHFRGSDECVSNTAHELGHGVGALLGMDQPYLISTLSTSLDESVACMAERRALAVMIQQSPSPHRKAELLGYRASILMHFLRHVGNFDFEMELHQRRRKEGELTSDMLGEMWINHRQNTMGPSLKVGPAYANDWVRVSHFYGGNFYNFPYVYAAMLVPLLEEQRERDPKEFGKRFVAMQRDAGNQVPSTALKKHFGIDGTKPATWNHATKLIAGELDQLEMALGRAKRAPLPASRRELRLASG